ncbi:hypothetical protein GC176_17700 [bacterium]|nr:hypothetical protein [bacterium]
MFADLDWTTPANKASLEGHWRVMLGMVAGAVLTTVLLHDLYPNTFWFMKIWAGVAIGFAVGTVVITGWQLHNKERRQRTSGRLLCTLIFGFGLFTTVSLLDVVPDLASQEAKLRSVRAWDARDIVSLAVELEDHSTLWIDAPSVISDFVTCTQQATLFYPGHEGSLSEIQITVHLSNEQFETFPARIPEHHQFDVSLKFRGYSQLLRDSASQCPGLAHGAGLAVTRFISRSGRTSHD